MYKFPGQIATRNQEIDQLFVQLSLTEVVFGLIVIIWLRDGHFKCNRIDPKFLGAAQKPRYSETRLAPAPYQIKSNQI